MKEVGGRRQVVLVPGICTDGSVWRKVIPLLLDQQLEVTVAQIPCSTMEEDVGTVRRTLDVLEGPVTLVGLSYGGLVISAIGTYPRVTGLVYLAALAPDENETVSYLMAKEKPIYMMEPISDEAGWLWPPQDIFTNGMAQDVDAREQRDLWAERKSFGGTLFSSVVHHSSWRHKPSWYLVATEDRMLHPGTQRFMAGRMGAHVQEVASSHLVPMSQPEAVSKIITDAASGFPSIGETAA